MEMKEPGAVLAYEPIGAGAAPWRWLIEALPWIFFILLLDALLEYPAWIFEPILKDFKVNLPDISRLYLSFARIHSDRFMPVIFTTARIVLEALLVCFAWRQWNSAVRTWLLVLIGLELGDIVLHVINWLVVGGIDNTSMQFQRTAVGAGHTAIVVLRVICVLGAISTLKKSGRRLRYRWVAAIACGLLIAFVIVALLMPMLTLIEAVSAAPSRAGM